MKFQMYFIEYRYFYSDSNCAEVYPRGPGFKPPRIIMFAGAKVLKVRIANDLF